MNSCKPYVLVHSTWVVEIDTREAEKGAVWGYRKPMQSGLEAWLQSHEVCDFPAYSWFMVTLSLSSLTAWDRFGCPIARKLFFMFHFSPWAILSGSLVFAF